MITETALLGTVLWILSVHFPKEREDLSTKKMRKIRKERLHRAFSHILRWLLVIYLPTQKRGMGM